MIILPLMGYGSIIPLMDMSGPPTEPDTAGGPTHMAVGSGPVMVGLGSRAMNGAGRPSIMAGGVGMCRWDGFGFRAISGVPLG